MARNLTNFDRNLPRRTRYLVHACDPLFTEQFGRTLNDSGTRLVKLSARSPNLNTYAERFVRSIKSECLIHVIPVGERHLCRCVSKHVEHYHHEQNHQGPGNKPIEEASRHRNSEGSRECRERPGGVLRYYRREE